MKAIVEIKLTKPAQKKHLETMRTAAEYLTTDKKSISIMKEPNKPKFIIVEFAVKKAPQYKIVDEIADQFTDYMDDYNDITISFLDEKKKGKSRRGRKPAIPQEIKDEVVEIVEKFNKRNLNSDVFYIARFKGKYLYLDRNEYGTVGKICRLEFMGDIDSWEFSIFTYSDERYELDAFFEGEENLDGTVTGAMKAGLAAYPV